MKCALAVCLIGSCTWGCQTHRINIPRSEPATAIARLPQEKPSTQAASSEATALQRLPAPAVTTASAVTSPLREQNTVVKAGLAVPEPVPVIKDTAPAEMPHDDLGVTLMELEQLALANNPSIMQATAVTNKADGFRTQVALRLNPSFGYTGAQLWDAGTDQHAAFVSQDFVRGNKLELNRSVLEYEVRTTLHELDAQRLKVLTDLRQKYYVALAAQRRLQLTEEIEKLAQESVRVVKGRFDAGEAPATDVLQAEIQLQQVRLAAKQATANFRGTFRQLASIAGVPDLTERRLAGSLELPLDPRDTAEMEAQLLAASPELRAAETRLDRARQLLARQEAQAIPNISVMGGVGNDVATKTQFGIFQIGIPIPIRNANQGNIAAANAEVCRASYNIERVRLSLKARLAATLTAYEVARLAVQRYETDILPRAKESLERTLNDFRGGESDFLHVFVARKTYFDAALETIDNRSILAQNAMLIDGQLLAGGLDDAPDTETDAALRDQTLNGQ
jgi:cobalt-zinc-cadmium efflux system outer membrane protein